MTPLVAAGVELMLIGMGTVFFFLTLLIVATSTMSRLVARFAPPVAVAPAGPATTEQAEEVAAITAAIAEHRRRGRRA